MTMSMPQLREQLSAIEPDESIYEGIGASEVDLLRELLDDEEPWLAARAAHALSRIDAEPAHDALLSATQSQRSEVRVAVAASAHVLPPRVSDQVLSRLLDDSELGVRKFAIKSVSDRNSDAVTRRLGELAAGEPNTALRRIAEERASSIS
ncbi:MAG: HEAT repeat domain-containing protein [Dehalococcoidia bacterium]